MELELYKFKEHRQVDLVSYCKDTQELTIKFCNGKAYVYRDVPRKKYTELLEAPSVGSYLNRNIKGFYRFRVVENQEALKYTMLDKDFKKLTLNLCETCDKCLVTCNASPLFGNGFGNDNVYECNDYLIASPAEEKELK